MYNPIMANLADREDLQYTTQATLYEDDTAPSVDEADLSALKRIKNLVDEAVVTATNVRSIDLKNETLTGEQQIFAYQFALEFLDPIKVAIDSAIDKVNKQNTGGGNSGRRTR